MSGKNVMNTFRTFSNLAISQMSLSIQKLHTIFKVRTFYCRVQGESDSDDFLQNVHLRNARISHDFIAAACIWANRRVQKEKENI